MKSEANFSEESSASVFWLNRRSHPRHVLVRRSAIVHAADGTSQACVVLNISAGGMLARTYRPSVPGERVRVELVPGETIDGSVLWEQDWSIGIAFDDLIDVEELLARPWIDESAQDRRRSPRFPVSCPASLRVNARFHYGRICDISGGGARFRGTRALKKAGPALLTLPDLPPLRAAIAWNRDRECGLVFDEDIPQEVVSRWLSSRTAGEG
jgi:hypothetical protein